jgi:hypothetical protein
MRRAIILGGLGALSVLTFFVACETEGPSALSNGETLPPGPSSMATTMPTATGTGTTGGGMDGGGPGLEGGGGGDGGMMAVRDFSTNRADFGFSGPSKCATAGVLLCEDFESGMIDPGTWTQTLTNGGTMVVDTTQAARGSNALHITKSGSGASYLKETKTFPAPGNTYYGRAFFRFKNLPTPNPDASFAYSHWTIAAASGSGTMGEIRVSGQMQNAKNFFGVGTDSTPEEAGTGDWTNSDNDPGGGPVQPPLSQWLCIEWEHSGATNETRFYWDAVEHPSLYTTATVHGGNQANQYILPTFDNVWVGWQEYQGTGGEIFELWVDEIAIDSARIGCVL